jgi:hypothetical protein
MPPARAVVLLALTGVVPAAAHAQEPAGTTPSAPAAAAPAASAAPATPVYPATAYGGSPPPRHKGARAHEARSHPPPTSPDAVMPGFETLADGTTRLFVELTKPVAYETKTRKGGIVLVLEGAHVGRRNNCNPLVTVHFNTPVTTARLVPHHKDLWFVVDLRADVQPTVTMDATKEGGAMVRIEFPPGHYLPSAPPPPATAPPAPPPPPLPTVTPPVISSPRGT